MSKTIKEIADELELNDPHKMMHRSTKKLLVADYTILALILVMFLYLSFQGQDTSQFAVVLGVWTAHLAISSGFYYWKAKAENLQKMPIHMLLYSNSGLLFNLMHLGYNFHGGGQIHGNERCYFRVKK